MLQAGAAVGRLGFGPGDGASSQRGSESRCWLLSSYVEVKCLYSVDFIRIITDEPEVFDENPRDRIAIVLIPESRIMPYFHLVRTGGVGTRVAPLKMLNVDVSCALALGDWTTGA